MPIYEYRCHSCGHLYEKLQSIHDTTRPPCDACSSEDTDRLVSMSAFHLKGSGWYVTDYKGKSNGNKPVESKAETETKTETATDTKTDSKTETKTESPSPPPA